MGLGAVVSGCGSSEGMMASATTTGVTTVELTAATTDTGTATGTSEAPPTTTETGAETITTMGMTGTSAPTSTTTESSTESTTTMGVETMSGSETATDSESGTEPPPPCMQGEVVCEGGEAKVCDGMGGFESSEPCEAACEPGVGCLACVPDAPFCEGDVAMKCASDGLSSEVVEDCDELQGISCNPDIGLCDGACVIENLQLNYIGCDYYPTITLQHDSYNSGTKVFAAVVANTADVPAAITVTRGAMLIKEETVAAKSVKAITLPWIPALTKGSGPSAVVAEGAYRLRSDRPVTVYQYNLLYASATNDASLLLPVNAWTGDYVVASYPHFPQLNYPGFYAVTAREDGTTVTLAPSATGNKVQAGGGVAADGTGVVVLNAGDVLQVATAAGGDLTGTGVSADKPVQVIAGHKCTNVPTGVDACDHLEEAMFPYEALAKEYIVVPPGQSPDGTPDHGQVVRFIAAEPNTTLTFVPDQGVPKVLAKAGDFVELVSTTARFKVSADKRFMVAQYMVGQGGGFGEADPSMLLATATEQYRKDYLFHAPPTWESNFVDIILKNGTTVSVDGQPVLAPVQIGMTGYSLARVKLDAGPLSDGNHTIVGSDRVGIGVYGLQDFGSYWVVGGLDLDHL
ncbi:IgGFc-binding protein [Nannocystis pusilla]|uniref:IgGFc-binding protein n=1 Tax=Nannocystis pusilla TaxID=889268 RepID=A0A9X3ER80_9BACT|nr:IgGFc-binding protein [Nannocystis pusilla]